MELKTYINNYIITNDQKWIYKIWKVYKTLIDWKIHQVIKSYKERIKLSLTDFFPDVLCSIKETIKRTTEEDHYKYEVFKARLLTCLVFKIKNSLRSLLTDKHKLSQQCYLYRNITQDEDILFLDSAGVVEEGSDDTLFLKKKFLSSIDKYSAKEQRAIIMRYHGYEFKEIEKKCKIKNAKYFFYKYLDTVKCNN